MLGLADPGPSLAARKSGERPNSTGGLEAGFSSLIQATTCRDTGRTYQ